MSDAGGGTVQPPAPRGLNSFRHFLIGMTRDVPQQLRRSATIRRAIRRGR